MSSFSCYLGRLDIMLQLIKSRLRLHSNRLQFLLVLLSFQFQRPLQIMDECLKGLSALLKDSEICRSTSMRVNCHGPMLDGNRHGRAAIAAVAAGMAAAAAA